MTPGAIAHEAHELSGAVLTAGMISDLGRAPRRRSVEAGAVAPGAKPPFGQDALAAVGTKMAKKRIGVEAAAIAAAPGAKEHALSYRLAAIDTPEDCGEDFLISLQECASAHFSPVELYSIAGFKDNAGLEILRHGFKHCRKHLVCVCKAAVRADGEGVLEEPYHYQIGAFAEAFVASRRPVEGPLGQDAGEVFV